MRKQLCALIPILLCSGQVFGYGSGASNSTHYRLTSVLFDPAAPANLSNLVLNQAEHPDLYKFKQVIIDGSNSEQAHHDPEDANTIFWFDNEGQWENLLRASQLPTRAFRDAYRSLGYIIHLTEDSTVPAHDRVIFHGYPTLYYVAPGGKLLDASKYSAVRSDGVEFVAGDYDLSTLPAVDISASTFQTSPGVWSNTPQYYNSNGADCRNVTRKLWLCDGEAAAAGHPDDYTELCSVPGARTWGTYSFPVARGCDYPTVGADLDWYPRRLYPTGDVEAPQTAHDMGRTALYLAIRLSSETLKRLSRTLPPVVTWPSSPITGGVAADASATFTLPIQENRTQGVFLTIRDASTRQPIRATISGSNLPSTTTVLDGRLKILLSSHMDADLTTLPWADQISVVWHRAPAISPGDMDVRHRQLDVQVVDEDGNVAAGVVLVTSTAAPVIMAQPANVTVTAGQTATFQVTASGAAPIDYQWAKNGTNVPGAGSAVYTTPPTTVADSGASFSATVSDSGGSVTSSGAILTVIPPPGQEILVNGGFESGVAKWSGNTQTIGTWVREPAHTGVRNAFLLGTGRTLSQSLDQTVTIPGSVGAAVPSFYLHIDTAETTTTTAFDKLDVQVLDSSGSVLSTLITYSNLDAASGYTLKTFDVSAYRGRTIRIRFQGAEDKSKRTSFVVDDVSLLAR